MTNEYVIEHIEVLREYIKLQNELLELASVVPQDEFEKNSHYVKSMECNVKLDVLTDKLNETIMNLGSIRA